MQGFLPWTMDDAGDLVNLAMIECITIAPLEEEQQKEAQQGGHEDWTHELLAIAPDQRSYRLVVGSENTCFARRVLLAKMLMGFQGIIKD